MGHRSDSADQFGFAFIQEEDPVLGRVHLHSCELMPELSEGTVDLTVTSPPYWNAIDYDTHSLDSAREYRSRGEVDYEEYLEFLERCFREVLRVHKEGSICAVVIGTVLLNRRHTPLPFHFTGRMEGLGWEFTRTSSGTNARGESNAPPARFKTPIPVITTRT